MSRFTNQVAAITGASSGIGRALALRLAERGAALSLSDIDPEGLERTAEAARETGVKVTTATVDVADRDAMHAWAEQTAHEHERVNFIFNNAGVALASNVAEIEYEDFEWIVGINFWGVVHGTTAFMPHLRASGRGHVVNISSVFGIIAVPTQGAYNATKFAVRGYTEALRQELAMERAPVSATVVCPGGIKTNIARAARMKLGKTAETNAALSKRFERMFMTPPTRAADIILRGVARDKARVLVGPDAHLIHALQRTLPTGYAYVTRAMAKRSGI